MSIDRLCWFAWLCVCAINWQSATAAEGRFEVEQGETSLQVNLNGKPLATYVWSDPKTLRPYFAHVRTPAGIQVTRNHPPREGQDATDHAELHPGLWMAFGDISAHDFWRNKGTVRHASFVEPPRADEHGAAFAVRNAYVAEGQTVCEEVCRLRFDDAPSGYFITWDSTFSGPRAFYFGDQEEMGLGVRVATPIAVEQGGHIVDSQGRIDEEQVWGQVAKWCDYRGKIDGHAVGVLLMPDPTNFRPSWFHARDYGVLVANPFGRNAFTKQDKSKVQIAPGEQVRFRFGVLVHEGDTDPAAAYATWLKRVKAID